MESNLLPLRQRFNWNNDCWVWSIGLALSLAGKYWLQAYLISCIIAYASGIWVGGRGGYGAGT